MTVVKMSFPRLLIATIGASKVRPVFVRPFKCNFRHCFTDHLTVLCFPLQFFALQCLDFYDRNVGHLVFMRLWTFQEKSLKYLSKVPRRASQVSALKVARLGLNDGAQLWISFKLFSKQTFFTAHIRYLHNKGFV